MRDLLFFFDYKSPYSYLALDSVYRLESQYDLNVEWIPFVLDIAATFGRVEERTPLQWDKVRHMYTDVRRWANKRGLIIKGPQKIFDSSLAAKGYYFIKKHGGDVKRYHATIFEKFFQRQLDIEDITALSQIIETCHVSAHLFPEFAQSEGQNLLQQGYEKARKLGVFGIPSFYFADELFVGQDRVSLLEEHIQGRLSGGDQP